MNYAVRYYSRSGNTKAVAEAFSNELGVDAISVDNVSVPANEEADILFIGGALYAYGIDEHLKAYLSDLSSKKIKKAVVFSTSWISKHAIELIKDSLEGAGIEVEKDSFYSRGKPGTQALTKAKEFVKKFC